MQRYHFSQKKKKKFAHSHMPYQPSTVDWSWRQDKCVVWLCRAVFMFISVLWHTNIHSELKYSYCHYARLQGCNRSLQTDVYELGSGHQFQNFLKICSSTGNADPFSPFSWKKVTVFSCWHLNVIHLLT